MQNLHFLNLRLVKEDLVYDIIKQHDKFIESNCQFNYAYRHWSRKPKMMPRHEYCIYSSNQDYNSYSHLISNKSDYVERMGEKS